MSQISWEQTIIKIRTMPEFKELVDKAYFEENLPLNIERFRASEEYIETRRVLQQYQKNAGTRILDIGAGNGISSIAFALDGYQVVALEPDPSKTIGNGAISTLKDHYQLDKVEVIESYGEDIPLASGTFDVVYARQAMHHAADLDRFVAEAARLLKPGGLFFTVRDHIVYDPQDKAWFLESHPLHKFYGGENAFSEAEYTAAIKKSGLTIQQVLKHYDSVINYFPTLTSQQVNKIRKDHEDNMDFYLKKRAGFLAGVSIIRNLYRTMSEKKYGAPLDEKDVPGRMYSFIAVK